MELRRVGVYCSSASRLDQDVEREIRTFGREIARRGVGLVYGGASTGLMGAVDLLLAQFEVAIQRKYARPDDRILYAVADNTQAILTMLEGAPVMARKAGEWT